MLHLDWKRFEEATHEQAMAAKYCLYVLYHPDDLGVPFYIGKAKYFGPSQSHGYERAARYNAGYQHLLLGLLHAGFSLYVAEIGESNFQNVEMYERFLIRNWSPVRNKRCIGPDLPVVATKPWATMSAAPVTPST